MKRSNSHYRPIPPLNTHMASPKRGQKGRRGCFFAGIAILILAAGLMLFGKGLWLRFVQYPLFKRSLESMAQQIEVPGTEDLHKTVRAVILPHSLFAEGDAANGVLSAVAEQTSTSAVLISNPASEEEVWISPSNVVETTGVSIFWGNPDNAASGQNSNVSWPDFSAKAIYCIQQDVSAGQNAAEDPSKAWKLLLRQKGRAFLLDWHRKFFDPPEASIKAWDALNSGLAPHAGVLIAGTDTDDKKLSELAGDSRNLENLFAFAANYVLIPAEFDENDSATEENQDTLAGFIWDGLRQGHVYFAFDWLIPAHEVVFTADSPVLDRGMGLMGDFVPYHRGITLYAGVPVPCRLHLLRDGEIVQTSEDVSEMEYLVDEPGVYRLEAWLDILGQSYPWIYTNPICIAKSSG